MGNIMKAQTHLSRRNESQWGTWEHLGKAPHNPKASFFEMDILVHKYFSTSTNYLLLLHVTSKGNDFGPMKNNVKVWNGMFMKACSARKGSSHSKGKCCIAAEPVYNSWWLFFAVLTSVASQCTGTLPTTRMTMCSATAPKWECPRYPQDRRRLQAAATATSPLTMATRSSS